MSDDSLERTSAADPLKREASPARDSWMDRLKLALGLKEVGSIRDDLEEALDEAESGVDDEFSVEERRILRNLLAARDVRVQDVMVPRGAIIGISEAASFAELRALFGSAGHSRLPVYAETLDDPKGMIHIRDMFARLDAVAGNTKISETGLLRPVLFAPGTMPALDLLLDMQRRHIHMALVIDEYGATDGLVSLEDLLEIIVGEIEDEHDVLDDPNIERLADGSIAIDARAGVDDVARMMQVPFAPPSDEHDIESIGGYVTALIGRVPAVGEAIAAPNGLVFTVMEGDQRRLKRVRIAAIPPSEAARGVMSGVLVLERAEALAHHILLMPGRKRHALAFAAGLAAALALAPLDFLPGFLLAFPLLVLLVDNGEYAGKGGGLSGFLRAAITGWWFGFGYFLAGLWWLGAAFITGGDQFIWLMPLGVVGLPAFLALFPAFGVGMARLLWCPGPLRVFALAFGLSLAEWLRSFIFTGFPWNSFGQAFANHLTLVQGASLIGADGLGVLAIVIFSTPALILTGRDGVERWALPCAAALMFALLFLFGWLRLEGAGGSRIDMRTLPVVADVQLRIVQPNRKLEPRDQAPDGMAVLRTLLSLSDRASGPQAMGVGDVTHLIWPEAPLPFVLERAPQALEAIRTFLPANTRLITGGIRTDMDPNEPGRTRFFNTMQVIDQSGISAQYDKVHLVPFGEYLPFDLFLRAIGLEQFVRVVGGFTAAPRRVRLPVPGLPPVIPLICFESIFAHELEAGEDGGKVFINITNDAWFGRTPGPYQHLAQARLRSVEFGQPLVRAANSGISAVFDPYGRIVSQSRLDKSDILDAPLPQGLTNTLYRRASWYSFAGVMVCCLIFAFAGWLRR